MFFQCYLTYLRTNNALFNGVLLAIQPLTLALAIVGKIGSAGAFGVVYVFSAELFPTVVRNAGMGASSCIARVGGMLAPYVASSVRSSVFYQMQILGHLRNSSEYFRFLSGMPEKLQLGVLYRRPINIIFSPKVLLHNLCLHLCQRPMYRILVRIEILGRLQRKSM